MKKQTKSKHQKALKRRKVEGKAKKKGKGSKGEKLRKTKSDDVKKRESGMVNSDDSIISSKPLEWEHYQFITINVIDDVFQVMEDDALRDYFRALKNESENVHLLVTANIDRVLAIQNQIEWGKNVWLGVSISDQSEVDRIDKLRNTGAYVKFLSLEPLRGPLEELNLENIDLLIVGGESGIDCQPIPEEWVLSLRDQCLKNKVSFTFTKWGGNSVDEPEPILEGQRYKGIPKKGLDFLILSDSISN